LGQIEIVLQYNKRDLPNVAPIIYLEYMLNNRMKRLQRFDTIAGTGVNVFSTLDSATQLLLRKLLKENGRLLAGRR
jgi:mutual gliding-motility protein MglA